jgi:membrane protein DedA with SNARE-associated domain
MIFTRPIRIITAIFRNETKDVQWGKLAVMILGLIGLSFGLAYLFQQLITKLHLPLNEFAWIAYLIVFLSSLLANLTVIAPVPIGLSIMIAAAKTWNPAIVALSASAGASIGELSGYLAGYLGRKIAIPGTEKWVIRFDRWFQRWGAWAIFFIAFQPILPFDIGGIIAGTAKMPLYKLCWSLDYGSFTFFLVLRYPKIFRE